MNQKNNKMEAVLFDTKNKKPLITLEPLDTTDIKTIGADNCMEKRVYLLENLQFPIDDNNIKIDNGVVYINKLILEITEQQQRILDKDELKNIIENYI